MSDGQPTYGPRIEFETPKEEETTTDETTTDETTTDETTTDETGTDDTWTEVTWTDKDDEETKSEEEDSDLVEKIINAMGDGSVLGAQISTAVTAVAMSLYAMC